jgi:hypothetical protein
MSSKPDPVPPWASGGGATVTTPTTQQIENGFLPRVPPSAGHTNYIIKALADTAIYLQDSPPGFSTVQEAIDDLIVAAAAPENVNQTFVLNGQILGAPSASITPAISGSVAVQDICCTGRFIVWSSTGTGPFVNALDGTAVQTLASSHGSGATRIASDGNVIVWVIGQWVECYEWSEEDQSWDQRWDYDHGGTVNDVCICDNRVYIVGAAVATNAARALNMTDGTVIWSFNHGAELKSVCAGNGAVIIAGNTSALASAVEMRALDAATGRDVSGHGTNGTDTTGKAWNLAVAAGVGYWCLASNSHGIYLNVPGTPDIYVYGYEGTVYGNIAVSGSATRMAVDEDLLLVGTAGSTDVLYAYDATSLRCKWLVKAGGSLGVGAVAIDATRGYFGVGGTPGAPQTVLQAVSVGPAQGLFATTSYLDSALKGQPNLQRIRRLTPRR